jgi:probable phosphoglycerate mutase
MAAGVHLDLFQRIVISPCSATVLVLGEGPPIVLAVNSTGDDLTGLAVS